MDKRLRYLNALRCFESAARLQSYTQAASELNITQAAVSQQMRQLETALEVKLFVRKGRNMHLTEAAEVLLTSTQGAFNRLIDGLNQIQMQEMAGSLTITSTQSFCSLWLMPNLCSFYDAYDDIQIRVLGSNRLEDIRLNHIDVAIRFSTKADLACPIGLEQIYLGGDKSYPVCSANYKAKLDLKTPADLARCDLIHHDDNKVSWKEWFEAQGLCATSACAKGPHTRVSSNDLALSAALKGQGVALVSKELFLDFQQAGLIVQLFDIPHPVVWQRYVLYDPHSPKRKRIQVFIDWLIDSLP
ncbi:LysR family transcriptional regulator [Pseudoalteromonas sp. McH1-7]|uniref:LysR substrate-binding domain-containing protein n=1 Tax=Pseudoalteromonas TaxID=53246 RepID=UPI00159169FE|nr:MULTISPECIES: LysR substrate-binding domain-containing protein [Pseudoalteromonas]MDW7548996.1 LysR substrate-binding domain-containing protein [Pseudoalteromonas peptidolytica]NUZ11226.1 LysR family transcriptional regulator [Pseudoalteromonas sp. McH1-7]USD30305.1 LysR family transcriptional regulator [Pseudoalteromonas sp. SCSIO 43201]